MIHNDLTFFTNEPERNLYERFNKILNSNTQFFDILVGYFRTSGFHRLYNSMKEIEKIRVLVGINVDRKTALLVNEAKESLSLEILSHKEAKINIANQITKEFEASEDTLEVEQGVRCFIEWIKSGKMEIRVYPEAKIHAKVYIMRKNMDKVPDNFGSVITGSSNFSESGLINNLEFNVELKDSRDVQFALDHFEKLWLNSVELNDTYVETIEKSTWLKQDITPYELYLKTLYEYFKEELDSDKEVIDESLLPKGYLKLQYQFDAVIQAKKILETYNGVFISDVVGLGKTYICAMLAKSLDSGKKLIICPPVLVDYWRNVLTEFDVAATVESLGKLNKLIEDGVDEYKYVFIDEAHRFRNQDTEGFKLLHQICFNKKVVLISATPINNYSSDIENQIYLFQSKHNSTIIPDYKNIEAFFKNLNLKLKKQEKGTPEYYDQLKKNSEEIRDNVLRHIMIRRTRNEIVEYYSDDLMRQGLSFPTLETPQQVIYELDRNIETLFGETMETIKNLKYARYTPLLFLKYNKKYANLMVSQHNMGGFMKSILVKRLESSFFAFKMTLDRFIKSYENFLAMCDNEIIYISKKVNIYDLLDNGDIEKLMDLVNDDKVQKFNISEFNDDFIPSLNSDLDMLRELKRKWENVGYDPKLQTFKEELKGNSILANNKIIIFSESKETANYLGEELKEYYGDRLIVFTGESSVSQKREIEQSFNPKYSAESRQKYDILITTDVLAEGINLHRSNILINYDLPWNPTKIMQRVGRINRVGTTHEKIYVFNFFPTSQTNKHLPLKDRIIEKLQAFHDTLGEDFKYLSEAEEVTSHKLYMDLNDILKEDRDSFNSELHYLSELRNVRDNDKKTFEKILEIPLKSKTGKVSDRVVGNATITFFRRGLYKVFYKTEGMVTEQLNFINAIKYIEANQKDRISSVEEIYFEELQKNKSAFLEKINENEVINKHNVGIHGTDAKMVKILKALLRYKGFTEIQEENIIKFIDIWENGDIPQVLTKEILKKLKPISHELEAYEVIKGAIPPIYLNNQLKTTEEGSNENEIILSCYLKEKI